MSHHGFRVQTSVSLSFSPSVRARSRHQSYTVQKRHTCQRWSCGTEAIAALQAHAAGAINCCLSRIWGEISSPQSQRYRSVDAGAKMCDVAPDRGADHLGAHRGGLRTCRVACEPKRERAFFIEDSKNADSDRTGSAKARHGPPTSVSDPFTALVSTLRGKPCKRRGQPAQTRIRTLRSEPAVSLAPRRRGPGRTPDPHRVIV